MEREIIFLNELHCSSGSTVERGFALDVANGYLSSSSLLNTLPWLAHSVHQMHISSKTLTRFGAFLFVLTLLCITFSVLICLVIRL